MFKRRMAVIGAERTRKLEKKKSERVRKQEKERVKSEVLSVDVEKYGGYWKFIR